MGVEDLQRVYDPAYLILEEPNIEIQQPNDLLEVQQQNVPEYNLLQDMIQMQQGPHPDTVVASVTRRERWIALQSILQYARLREALQRKFGTVAPHMERLEMGPYIDDDE
jgi:hypothetical protein